MADVSKIKLTDGTTRDIKDAAVRERVTALENAGLGGIAKQYTVTLAVNSWSFADNTYTYNLSLPALTCGTDGTVSPIISYTSNVDDYSYIETAMATAGVGIVFTTKVKPSADIGILIIDVK